MKYDYEKYEEAHRKFLKAVATLEKVICEDRPHCTEIPGETCCLCRNALYDVNLASIGVSGELTNMYRSNKVERLMLVTEANDFYSQLGSVFNLTPQIRKKSPEIANYLHQMQIRRKLADEIVRSERLEDWERD